jgi:hypothetical protein
MSQRIRGLDRAEGLIHVGGGLYDLAVSITLVIDRVEATLENGRWNCPSSLLRKNLEAHLGLCPFREGPGLEERQALWISNRIGAAIIPRFRLTPPTAPPSRAS